MTKEVKLPLEVYTEQELREHIKFLHEQEIKINQERRLFQAELKYRGLKD